MQCAKHKKIPFLVFLAELIYLYFRNLIFKEEETGNLVVTGTDTTREIPINICSQLGLAKKFENSLYK